MARYLSYIFFVILLLSCHSNTNNRVIPEQIDTLKLPDDSSVVYFPFPDRTSKDMLENNKGDSFEYDWYSKMLFALHEPILYDYKGENEIYRFTWLRTFDNPVAIRLQKHGSKTQLFSKLTNGAGV